MSDFRFFNLHGHFSPISRQACRLGHTFSKRSSYAEIQVDYDYITQMAVADDNKGHIVDFLEIVINFFDIFFHKKAWEKLSRDFFDYFLVSSCSQGYCASYKNTFGDIA